MTKNGHNAKAIAHAKYLVWITNKLPKTCEKRSYKRIKVVLWKKRLLKTEENKGRSRHNVETFYVVSTSAFIFFILYVKPIRSLY